MIFFANRKFFAYVSMLILSISINELSADQVSCEKIQSKTILLIGPQRTCFLNDRTSINSAGATFGGISDENVTGLEINGNRKVFHLPEKVSEKFPNLELYLIYSTSVTSIEQKHFKDMRKLRALHLNGNKIEKIPFDTFEDLVSLEQLELSELKMTYIYLKIIKLRC